MTSNEIGLCSLTLASSDEHWKVVKHLLDAREKRKKRPSWRDILVGKSQEQRSQILQYNDR